MTKSLLKLFTLCFLGFFVLSAYIVSKEPSLYTAHAQRTETGPTREYTLLEPLPCVDGIDCENGGLTTKVDLVRYLNILFKLAIGLAGVLAVFMIVVGGFQYATTDAFQEKSDGKTKIWNAIQGLLFALVSYFILYTIDPRFVQFRALEPLGIKEVELGDITVELGDLARQTRTTLEIYEEEIKALREKASHPDTTEEEAIDLLIQANELEKTSIDLWTRSTTEISYLAAIDRVESTGSSYNKESLSEIEKVRERMNQNYSKGIEDLKRSGGDPETVKKWELEQATRNIEIETALAIKAIKYGSVNEHFTDIEYGITEVDTKVYEEKIIQTANNLKQKYQSDPKLIEQIDIARRDAIGKILKECMEQKTCK